MKLKDKLTSLELRFFCFIPHGMEHPRPRKEFERVFGMSKRQVEKTVESLIHKGIPVCAIKEKDGGYFIPDNEEERQIGLRPNKSQIETTKKRIKAVESVDLNNFRAIAEDLRHG
ncbi:hypothetical protein A9Q68_08465 [Streptococcus bovimastitidis]|uniref:Helix-turn-helix type 11 domain-containing protein n=1 Tax=Streptococcus bovimastitidis TaxID=1856638 RepID=A0A1L8MKD9_9STRE|nr:hypothetical protein [Streptococcus bovimastitidis]OJF71223.1 hypothetical protein A9Q68_08465 [Streptococcus bovimastitidis]